MTLPGDQPLQKLQFYVTTGYSCGYLPNKLAQSLIAAPQHLVNTEIYSGLIQQGFRRSGKFAYRPHCENCRECVPVRIKLDEFSPNRSQARAYKQHQNLTAHILPVDFHEEHYLLYAAYQRARHADSVATQADVNDDNDIEQYRNFLCQSNVESVLVEFRDQGKLVMVSVIDIVVDGISAVYTFYDTSTLNSESTHKRASYGTYNVIWQTLWAKQLNLPYLYLGYWIKDSPKMTYKQNFKPLEKLIDGEWLKSKT
jgi:arginyl-tRNA--protein-N-Asp/Glu arginylyltransferase